MPQHPINLPVGAQISATIDSNATTLINSGNRAVLAGVICSSAGSAWTYQFYNGNPANGGTAVGPAITAAAGISPMPELSFPQGLYVVTAGTTAGSLQIAFYA